MVITSLGEAEERENNYLIKARIDTRSIKDDNLLAIAALLFQQQMGRKPPIKISTFPEEWKVEDMTIDEELIISKAMMAIRGIKRKVEHRRDGIKTLLPIERTCLNSDADPVVQTTIDKITVQYMELSTMWR